MFDPAQHCRIRRVRMKGGADITLLKQPDVSDLGVAMIADARAIADRQGRTLTGFFIVGWDKEGAYSSGSRVVDGIPLTLLPAWIAEVARRDMVTTKQVHEVLQDHYVVDPPRPPSA